MTRHRSLRPLSADATNANKRTNVVASFIASPFEIASQDFLAESGEDELDAEESGAVVFVEDGIDLDDFEGNHGLGVGDHFHGEMGFAIGAAAAHGSADAGGVGGLGATHIEGDGGAGGRGPGGL